MKPSSRSTMLPKHRNIFKGNTQARKLQRCTQITLDNFLRAGTKKQEEHPRYYYDLLPEPQPQPQPVSESEPEPEPQPESLRQIEIDWANVNDSLMQKVDTSNGQVQGTSLSVDSEVKQQGEEEGWKNGMDESPAAELVIGREGEMQEWGVSLRTGDGERVLIGRRAMRSHLGRTLKIIMQSYI